ncbi:MAG TPA: PQQ-binding-like beta-propeller repeat protein, partial [Chloroflexota bacterium]|nr:PQQ-binding-like beta-propeller repeat protein [Chloroflexota bacterium]
LRLPPSIGRRPWWARVMAGAVLLGGLCGGATWVERETSASAIVRALAVGPSPLSVALDDRSGHAFVLSGSPDSPDAASVTMMDTVTGALLRTQAVGRVPQALAVDDRDGHVLVANGDNTVHVLAAQNGVAFFSGHVQSASTGATMIAVAQRADHAFVTGDTAVSMLDAGNGRVLRSIALGVLLTGVAVDTHRDHVFATGYNGASGVGTVSMLDATSGAVLHTVTLDQSPSPGPTVVDERSGHAFVLDRSIDSFSIIDTASGRLLHSINVGAQTYPQAVDGHTGRVFIAVSAESSAGRVRVLDARSGRILHMVMVGWDPIALVVAVRAGRVFAVNAGSIAGGSTGSISVLDATSGRLVHTVRLGMLPHAAAVDERAGRLVVVGDPVVGVAPVTDVWGWMPPWLRHWLPFVSQQRRRIPSVSGRASILDLSRL